MDREKVIKGLNDIGGFVAGRIGFNQARNFLQTIDDAVELLKEKEAKQVIKQTYHVMMNRDYENPVEVTRYDWLCPTCKSLLCRDIDVIDDNYHFCKVCGQAVKWNDKNLCYLREKEIWQNNYCLRFYVRNGNEMARLL